MSFLRIFFIFIFSVFFLDGLFGIEAFPPIKPYRSGMLAVDEVHQIYWEESGNPEGVPVIFLHGGPGVGTEDKDRTFFDPTFYRIILFDQRGCGKSLPYGSLINNTTWDLVEDIRKLREFLLIDRCLLFGGSWGTTLALAYAIKYPENVLGLILRGVFLCQQNELDWFYRNGANTLSPKAWQILNSQVSKEKQEDLIAAYHDLLQSDSYRIRAEAAAAWVLWEFANLQAIPDYRLDYLLNYRSIFYLFAFLYANQILTHASIENHYFFHKGFFETEGWILENIDKIQEISSVIIQGECDQICPKEYAEELHSVWPLSSLILVPDAGHASTEPGILEALILATENFKTNFFAKG
jgi:proline iminopeptidase